MFGKRRKELEELNDYLTRILSGETTLPPLENEEGELSILRSNIYKAVGRLINVKDYEKESKINLANALADITHQLKTPLTSITVMNDLLKDETDEKKRQEFIAIQSAQIEKMNWLVQNLLKISKIDAGSVTLKQERISLKELVSLSLVPLLVLLELKKINVINEEGSVSDAVINCDKKWTAEALTNIMKNCAEHMDEGGRLSVSYEDNNIYCAVKIEDNGSGIAKEDLPHIFERFYRGKNSSADSVGIGLSLSNTIIEKQKGEILVESEVGEGSVFTIKFYKTVI
ncbi:MAG: HAMP domain-containing histidine kinase [Lachnospiraceae bacterium]|nr:HAMP domain-containing histidine kinase [Lachnospiraceae bacterium]